MGIVQIAVCIIVVSSRYVTWKHGEGLLQLAKLRIETRLNINTIHLESCCCACKQHGRNITISDIYGLYGRIYYNQYDEKILHHAVKSLH